MPPDPTQGQLWPTDPEAVAELLDPPVALDVPWTRVELENGSALVWSVGQDGTAAPWIVADPDATGPVHVDARHEQLGRLPDDYEWALTDICGVPTVTGQPCRNPVKGRGCCHVHA